MRTLLMTEALKMKKPCCREAGGPSLEFGLFTLQINSHSIDGGLESLILGEFYSTSFLSTIKSQQNMWLEWGKCRDMCGLCKETFVFHMEVTVTKFVSAQQSCDDGVSGGFTKHRPKH